MAWDAGTVAAFDEGGADILVLEYPPLPGLAEAVAAARVHGFKALVTPHDAEARAAEALASLGVDLPALGEAAASLARAFLAQLALARAGLLVEVVEKATCPKFHCDNVRMRLVATLHGPGTEYVRADEAGQVHAAPSPALVFLKGHKHPRHADAVHHRSPAVPEGSRRLCVILDC